MLEVPLSRFELGETALELHPGVPGLFLVVGEVGSGKTVTLRRLAEEHQFEVHNVSLEFGRRLLEMEPRARPVQAARIFASWLDHLAQQTLGLDNIDLLFETSLRFRPLALLSRAARRRCIVATWLGTWDGKSLSHAYPGHPEHVRILERVPAVLYLGTDGGHR